MAEPDWFILLSGGKDSTVAAHLSYPALDQNYRKRPVVIYLDTRMGMDLQRIYVEHLCDTYGWQLWTLRTHEKYEEIVRRHGHPGGGQHGTIQNSLKGRQRSKLVTVAQNPIFVAGIRWDESPSRAETRKAEYKDWDRAWYVNPILSWSDEDLDAYVEEHDIPENPLWGKPYPTDCWCGAMGHPEELIEAEADGFEWWTRRIREIEESVNHGDKTDTWGWGGYSPKRQRREDAQNDPDQMSLCGPSCAYDALPGDD